MGVVGRVITVIALAVVAPLITLAVVAPLITLAVVALRAIMPVFPAFPRCVASHLSSYGVV